MNTFGRDGCEVDGLRFSVTIEPDHDAGAPWDNMDTLGTVRDVYQPGFSHLQKEPGERVMHRERGEAWLYDYAGAVAKARKEGMSGPAAAEAADREFSYLRGWLRGSWCFVGVIVTLLDTEGNPTNESDALWGVDDAGDYVATIAEDLALGLHSRLGHLDELVIPERRIPIREAA